jgi:hypothetical protein
MSLFDEYYDEYNTHVKITADCTAELLSADAADTEAHEEPRRRIEEALNGALEVIAQMEVHGRSLRKKKNKDTILTDQIERQLLFRRDEEFGLEDVHEVDQDSRDQLIATTDTLHGASDSLKRSLTVLDETTSVGNDIAIELKRNREKIESAQARIGSVSIMADQARRSIHSMAKRENRQRAIVVAVVVGILVVG